MALALTLELQEAIDLITDDILDGNFAGTGVFDQFMKVIDAHVKREYDAGRIQGQDYATVYLGALQLAMQQSVAYVQVAEQVRQSELKNVAETLLLKLKAVTEHAQTADSVGDLDNLTFDTNAAVLGAVGTQKSLQSAQANGFLRDAEQKATKILMDAWSVSKSISGDLIDPPDGAQNDDIEDVIIKLRQGINITSSIYKFQANAGPNQAVGISSVVRLDGTGSTSPSIDTAGESISAYQWTILESPGTTPALIDATTVTPTFTATADAGDYRVQLQITGSLGSISYDEVIITAS